MLAYIRFGVENVFLYLNHDSVKVVNYNSLPMKLVVLLIFTFSYDNK